MAFSAKAVANYFFDLAQNQGKTLTPMKMQKLVYYAHGWHLAIAEKPLIDEQVEAWKFGPVIRSLYADLATYGMKPITQKIDQVVVNRNLTGSLTFEFTTPELPTSGDDAAFARKVIERIWELYGGYTAVQLSNMTHAPGSPWHKVFEEHQGALPKATDIPQEAIKDYFASMAKK